jgi:hypothetical protein
VDQAVGPSGYDRTVLYTSTIVLLALPLRYRETGRRLRLSSCRGTGSALRLLIRYSFPARWTGAQTMAVVAGIEAHCSQQADRLTANCENLKVGSEGVSP